MNYTIAEKVLLEHSTVKNITPGQFIEGDIDLIMVHEQLGGRIHKEYEKLAVLQGQIENYLEGITLAQLTVNGQPGRELEKAESDKLLDSTDTKGVEYD